MSATERVFPSVCNLCSKYITSFLPFFTSRNATECDPPWSDFQQLLRRRSALVRIVEPTLEWKDPPPKPLFVNGVSCSALDRWEVYKWAGREVRIIHEDTKFYFIFKDKNQVWHSHNFFLPCITLEENFINRVTSRFRSFVMHYNWMNCLFFYIDCLSFFPLTPILFPSPVAFN